MITFPNVTLVAVGRRNMYDGTEEFWVVVKESGQREESQSYKEVTEKRQKAGYRYH